jgi:hypothetical protein
MNLEAITEKLVITNNFRFLVPIIFIIYTEIEEMKSFSTKIR